MARVGRGLIASSPLCFAAEQTQDLEAFLVAQMVKNPPAMQEMWVQSLGEKDLLEKEMATNYSILAWRIP